MGVVVVVVVVVIMRSNPTRIRHISLFFYNLLALRQLYIYNIFSFDTALSTSFSRHGLYSQYGIRISYEHNALYLSSSLQVRSPTPKTTYLLLNPSHSSDSSLS